MVKKRLWIANLMTLCLVCAANAADKTAAKALLPVQTGQLFRAAQREVERDRPEHAIALLTDVLKIAPDNIVARRYRDEIASRFVNERDAEVWRAKAKAASWGLSTLFFEGNSNVVRLATDMLLLKMVHPSYVFFEKDLEPSHKNMGKRRVENEEETDFAAKWKAAEDVRDHPFPMSGYGYYRRETVQKIAAEQVRSNDAKGALAMADKFPRLMNERGGLDPRHAIRTSVAWTQMQEGDLVGAQATIKTFKDPSEQKGVLGDLAVAQATVGDLPGLLASITILTDGDPKGSMGDVGGVIANTYVELDDEASLRALDGKYCSPTIKAKLIEFMVRKGEIVGAKALMAGDWRPDEVWRFVRVLAASGDKAGAAKVLKIHSEKHPQEYDSAAMWHLVGEEVRASHAFDRLRARTEKRISEAKAQLAKENNSQDEERTRMDIELLYAMLCWEALAAGRYEDAKATSANAPLAHKQFSVSDHAAAFANANAVYPSWFYSEIGASFGRQSKFVEAEQMSERIETSEKRMYFFKGVAEGVMKRKWSAKLK